MDYAIGIDIGSTCAKTAVLAADGSFALLSARPTGWSSVDTAETIRAELEAAHFSPEAYPCVATGYGRVAVPYARKSVTEITCHARGACFLHGRDDLLVIDIGGQDTKVIGRIRRCGAGLSYERQVLRRNGAFSRDHGKPARYAPRGAVCARRARAAARPSARFARCSPKARS